MTFLIFVYLNIMLETKIITGKTSTQNYFTLKIQNIILHSNTAFTFSTLCPRLKIFFKSLVLPLSVIVLSQCLD